MNLSFNISKDQTSVSSGSSRRNLTPFAVHTVVFDGAEIISGTSKDGNEYKVMSLTFKNDEGTARLSIFFPKDGDGVRQKRTARDGHEYESPSRWDNNWSIMKQTLEVLSPKGYEKFAEIVPKCGGSIDKIFGYYVEILNKAKGTETNIKLNGYVNQQGYTQLTFPNICAVNKDHECFITDNFIGETVALSSYEIKRGEEFNSATPTNMSEDSSVDITTGTDSDDDIDLSDL